MINESSISFRLCLVLLQPVESHHITHISIITTHVVFFTLHDCPKTTIYAAEKRILVLSPISRAQLLGTLENKQKLADNPRPSKEQLYFRARDTHGEESIFRRLFFVYTICFDGIVARTLEGSDAEDDRESRARLHGVACPLKVFVV